MIVSHYENEFEYWSEQHIDWSDYGDDVAGAFVTYAISRAITMSF